MELVSIEDAMTVTKHRTKAGFRSFVRRINHAVPAESRIIMWRGLVVRDSIEPAMRYFLTMDRKRGA